MTPLRAVAPARKLALGLAFFVLFVLVWSIATFGVFA